MSGMVYKKSALESAVEAGSREFEDALLAKVGLRSGAKVRRGRDWKWGDQDGTGVGELEASGSVDGWVYVIWGGAAENCYRWGDTPKDGMAFDIMPLDPSGVDVSALTEVERAYIRTYGLLTHPREMSDVLVQAIDLSESGGCVIVIYTSPGGPIDLVDGEPVELPSNATPRPRVRSGMSSEDFRRFKEAMERQLRVDWPAKEPAKEPAEGERATVSEAFQRLSEAVDRLRQPEETEGERLARFFATSEHDRVRADEGFEVTEVRLSDASEPRNELRDVLMLWSPTAPGYGERLYDAMATDAYRREEDKRAAELREAVAAIRDDFDNLRDA